MLYRPAFKIHKGYLRAVMTILWDLLAYTGSVSTLNPMGVETEY